MFIVLFFTIIGFLSGLTWVMHKRRIKPGAILGVTLAGLFTAAAFKIIKESRQSRRKYF